MINNLRSRITVGLFFTTIFLLFLYSFTQIDLSLTFSRIEFLQNIVRSFQQIGYFNRPLSTYIYIGLVILLFGFYIYFLKRAKEKKLTKPFAWKLIMATTGLLVFSYNAFSYDLFNYIFDAKIFTHYHMNPYLHKALDFPSDPMLSFMRWTHRVYGYGPIWLMLTIPFSFIGMNFFLPTFFLFKIMIGAGYVGSVYFIGKILKRIKPEHEVLGLVFFGLNPLILIESLVSAHIDITMAFFALFATYKLIEKKYISAVLLLLFSVGIKFSTFVLIPVFAYIVYLIIKNKKINWSWAFGACVLLLISTIFLSSKYSGNFQPWYLILPLSFSAFLAYKYYVLIPGIILSFFALLNYAPYLYLGNWDKPVPGILFVLQLLSIGVSLLGVVLYSLFKENKA
jgi:uncharacterized membrane protein YqjE